MPQTMKEKRIKAVAGYKAAIARWTSLLESIKTRPTTKDLELITARERERVTAQCKIQALSGHVIATETALAQGRR